MDESSPSKDSLVKKYFQIFAVVSLYWFVSISLVFINKSLLSNGNETLEAPIFLTWFQCVIAVIIFYALNYVLKFKEYKDFPELTLNHKIMWKVLPLSVVFVTMTTFNNLCLKHLGVAFYYVGRSLVHVFNVIFTWFILGEKTSRNALICCAIIFCGFWLGVQQEGATGTLSVLGTIYGILSSIFLSLNSIYTKKVLVIVKQSVWLLGFYNNINACLLFVPLMIITGEIPIILTYEGFGRPDFWRMMVAGGIFGFAIGYVMALQIKLTSPLTNTISGTVKACAQTVLATHWYASETKPFLWWVSNWIVLFGGAAYARVRQLEMFKSHHQVNVIESASKSPTNTFMKNIRHNI